MNIDTRISIRPSIQVSILFISMALALCAMSCTPRPTHQASGPGTDHALKPTMGNSVILEAFSYGQIQDKYFVGGILTTVLSPPPVQDCTISAVGEFETASPFARKMFLCYPYTSTGNIIRLYTTREAAQVADISKYIGSIASRDEYPVYLVSRYDKSDNIAQVAVEYEVNFTSTTDLFERLKLEAPKSCGLITGYAIPSKSNLGLLDDETQPMVFDAETMPYTVQKETDHEGIFLTHVEVVIPDLDFVESITFEHPVLSHTIKLDELSKKLQDIDDLPSSGEYVIQTSASVIVGDTLETILSSSTILDIESIFPRIFAARTPSRDIYFQGMVVLSEKNSSPRYQSAGIGNLIPDAGEHLMVDIRLHNKSSNFYISTSAFIECEDRYITIPDVNLRYDELYPDSLVSSPQPISIQISPLAPHGYSIPIGIRMRDSAYSREMYTSFLLTVDNVGPIVFEQAIIDDDDIGGSTGDGDGIIEAEEIVEFIVFFKNNGVVSLKNVSVTIIPSARAKELVEILEDTHTYPVIPSGEERSIPADYDIHILKPVGHTPQKLTFAIIATALSEEPTQADLGFKYSWESSFEVTVNATDSRVTKLQPQ